MEEILKQPLSKGQNASKKPPRKLRRLQKEAIALRKNLLRRRKIKKLSHTIKEEGQI